VKEVILGLFFIVALVAYVARLRGRLTPRQWLAIAAADIVVAMILLVVFTFR
jgi:hypothetical protein